MALIPIYGVHHEAYFDGLVQDCSISISNELEMMQSWTKPLIC